VINCFIKITKYTLCTSLSIMFYKVIFGVYICAALNCCASSMPDGAHSGPPLTWLEYSRDYLALSISRSGSILFDGWYTRHLWWWHQVIHVDGRCYTRWLTGGVKPCMLPTGATHDDSSGASSHVCWFCIEGCVIVMGSEAVWDVSVCRYLLQRDSVYEVSGATQEVMIKASLLMSLLNLLKTQNL
jgi:hypothetical protein